MRWELSVSATANVDFDDIVVMRTLATQVALGSTEVRSLKSARESLVSHLPAGVTQSCQSGSAAEIKQMKFWIELNEF
jgi:hypothetical protein